MRATTPAAVIADGIVAAAGIAQLELGAYRDVLVAQGREAELDASPATADVLASVVGFIAARPREYSLERLATVARATSTWARAPHDPERLAEQLHSVRGAVPALHEKLRHLEVGALLAFSHWVCETLSAGVPAADASRQELVVWAQGVRAALRQQIDQRGGVYDDLLASKPAAGTRVLPWSNEAMANALPLVLAAGIFDLATALALSPGTLLAMLELLIVELRTSDESATVDAAIVDLERLEEAVIDGFRRHGLNLSVNRRLRWKIELRHGAHQVRDVVDAEVPSATYAGARVVLGQDWPEDREALRLRARELRAWVARELERAQAVHGATPVEHLREQATDDGVSDQRADRALQRLEILDEVRSLKAVLSKREREVVELRLEDFTFEEIAGQLGVESSTARVLHHNAVKKMRGVAADSAS